MNNLLSGQYSFRDQYSTQNASSHQSPRRVSNPLLPASPNNPSQHEYNLRSQQAKSHNYHNHLSLFTSPKSGINHSRFANNQKVNNQRKELIQSRQRQSQQLVSPNSFHATPNNESNPITPRISNMGSDYTQKPKHVPSQFENVQKKDIPNYLMQFQTGKNRISPVAERYRMRLKNDKWANVQKYHDKKDHEHMQQHKLIKDAKKKELAQTLKEQMKQNEFKKQIQIDRKQDDLKVIQERANRNKMDEQKEREYRYQAQIKRRSELDQFRNVQSKIDFLRKDEEVQIDRYNLDQAQQKLAEENHREYLKALREKERWDRVRKEEEVRKDIHLKEEKMRKAEDAKSMQIYAEMMEKEEIRRKQYLTSLGKQLEQRDAVNYKILEEKQRKLLQEEERLVRYQKLKEEQLQKDEIDRKAQANKLNQERLSFYKQQMAERERMKHIEMENARKERIELEAAIKRHEQERENEKNERKRRKNTYAKALEAQELEQYKKKLSDGLFMMDERDECFHKQYVNGGSSNQRMSVGVVPGQSLISKRDRKYLQ